jgi:hypothetical protein
MNREDTATSVIDYDREEMRSARLHAFRTARDECPLDCHCSRCIRDNYDPAEERP